MHALVEDAPFARAIAAILRRLHPGSLFAGAMSLVDDIVATPFSEGPAMEDRVRLIAALLEMEPLSSAEIARSVVQVAPADEEEEPTFEGYGW